MTPAERARRHRANLERINEVLLLAGHGDSTRIDREGTVLEQARLLQQEMQSHQATEEGLAAFDRLLRRLEDRHCAQGRDIVTFIRALHDNEPMSLRTLRGLEPALGDDVMAVLDAFRHARLSLVEQVEGGPARVTKLLAAWAATAV